MTKRLPMKYVVHNRNTEAVQVIVEPWAEEFTLPSGSALSVTIFDDRPDFLESEIGPNCFSAWLWGGCRAEVIVDDEHRTPRSLIIVSHLRGAVQHCHRNPGLRLLIPC